MKQRATNRYTGAVRTCKRSATAGERGAGTIVPGILTHADAYRLLVPAPDAVTQCHRCRRLLRADAAYLRIGYYDGARGPRSIIALLCPGCHLGDTAQSRAA